MVTLTARLEPELDAFITTYQARHQLSTRTEVIREALRALQQLERQQELRAGYQRMAQDLAQESDLWLDSGLQETLESMS